MPKLRNRDVRDSEMAFPIRDQEDLDGLVELARVGTENNEQTLAALDRLCVKHHRKSKGVKVNGNR